VQDAAKVPDAVSTLTIPLFGYDVNLMAVAFALLVIGVLFLFWRIQRTEKLDFADMITKDGRSVSLTKVLQLIGGLTATWIMIKLTLTSGINEMILGVYLAYVGGVEGYSKFIAAKYNYKETGVRQVKQSMAEEHEGDDPSLRPPKE
jgi:hypothetical protein